MPWPYCRLHHFLYSPFCGQHLCIRQATATVSSIVYRPNFSVNPSTHIGGLANWCFSHYLILLHDAAAQRTRRREGGLGLTASPLIQICRATGAGKKTCPVLRIPQMSLQVVDGPVFPLNAEVNLLLLLVKFHFHLWTSLHSLETLVRRNVVEWCKLNVGLGGWGWGDFHDNFFVHTDVQLWRSFSSIHNFGHNFVGFIISNLKPFSFGRGRNELVKLGVR
jgi:hypothetical protein